jgi:hypothetical protein
MPALGGRLIRYLITYYIFLRIKASFVSRCIAKIAEPPASGADLPEVDFAGFCGAK